MNIHNTFSKNKKKVALQMISVPKYTYGCVCMLELGIEERF